MEFFIALFFLTITAVFFFFVGAGVTRVRDRMEIRQDIKKELTEGQPLTQIDHYA